MTRQASDDKASTRWQGKHQMTTKQNFHLRLCRCFSSVSMHDHSVKHWLATPCHHIGSNHDRPRFLAYKSMHIGHKIAHVSHKLMIFRNLVYCNRCGMRGTNQLRKLSRVCAPPTEYGRESLQRLNQGKLPPNMSSWPD